MVPDFEFFLRFAPRGSFGHILPGIFILDLPLALIALWLFHAYAKEPLYAWLPESVRRRIQLGPSSPPLKNLAQFALVLLSILIGVATHILWDSFSHPRLWLYRHWQFLHRTVRLPLYGPLEVSRVIEHLSSVFGALVLLLWFWHWFRSTPPIQPEAVRSPRKNPRSALFVVSIVALVAAALRGFLLHRLGTPFPIERDKFALEAAIITAITVFWFEVVVYGAFRARAQSPQYDA
jgi:amino acid transporter